MRRFVVLLTKELRELVTLQMFLPFVVVIVVFVSIGQVLSDVGASQAETFPCVVADLDGGPYASVVMTALEQSGFEPEVVHDAPAPDEIGAALTDAGASVYVEIPEGFSASIAAGEPQELATWTRIRHFSFIGNAEVTAVSTSLAMVNSAVGSALAAEVAPGTPPVMLQAPVTPAEHVVIGDKWAATSAVAVMGFVSQQTTFIPIVLFVAIIFAAQMIATAIATEKENKTLETLLSYPVSRTAIVTAKMLAAGLVALVAGGAYMFGMNQYMSGIENGLAVDMSGGASTQAMQQLGLTFSAADYAMLGLTLFAGILVALAMSIILGAFAENVKAVQALLTPLMLLMFVPYFLTMFLDLSALPDAGRLAIQAIPFTYLFTAGPNLFLGNYGSVWFGIGYCLLWFAVFVTLAARVFSSDRILTMKLSMGRKKKGVQPE